MNPDLKPLLRLFTALSNYIPELDIIIPFDLQMRDPIHNKIILEYFFEIVYHLEGVLDCINEAAVAGFPPVVILVDEYNTPGKALNKEIVVVELLIDCVAPGNFLLEMNSFQA